MILFANNLYERQTLEDTALRRSFPNAQAVSNQLLRLERSYIGRRRASLELNVDRCVLSLTKHEKRFENGERASHCLAALIHGSAEPTLAQIPDAKGSKELIAMFRTLTRQPITVPVASLRIAKAKYDVCQTL